MHSWYRYGDEWLGHLGNFRLRLMKMRYPFHPSLLPSLSCLKLGDLLGPSHACTFSYRLIWHQHRKEIYAECLRSERSKAFTTRPTASLQRANARELGRCVDLSAVAHLEMAFQCLSLLPKVYFSEGQLQFNKILPFQGNLC